MTGEEGVDVPMPFKTNSSEDRTLLAQLSGLPVWGEGEKQLYLDPVSSLIVMQITGIYNS